MTSQSQAVTPVRVPKAATTYTPTTQDPDLRSQINTVLLREGHIEKIEQALHHALHAHPSNWPSKVSLHALSLLRSGECTTFPTLMERVLSDIRRDTEAARLLNHPADPFNPSLASGALGNNNKAGTAGTAEAAAATTTTTTTTTNTNTNTTPSSTASATSGSSPEQQRKAGKANGTAGGKGRVTAAAAGAGVVNGVVNGFGAGEGNSGLAVPQTVIEEGVRITRECLEQVCEVDE